MATGDFCDIGARTQRFFYDPPLDFGRPTSPTAWPAHNLKPANRWLPATTAFETNFVIKHVSYPASFPTDTLSPMPISYGIWGD